MKPSEAFQFIQQILSAQRLSLTPPEFARFIEAVKVVEVALQAKNDENTPRPPAS